MLLVYATADWMSSQDILLTRTFGPLFSLFLQARFPLKLVESSAKESELKHAPSRVGGVRS